mmetsp:Transcript_2703/g.8090  ORF Transcript_2703/g.8090 Transcript_2703/m.8090 type:complete len:265 (-) Transcript_2703:42-836(-)
MQVIVRQSRRAVLPTLSGASLRALEAVSAGQQQSFASKIPKGMVQPAGGKGEVFGSKMIKPSMVSSNILAEPYRGEKAPLPLSSWVTPSGWSLVWGRWKDSWKSMYSLSKLKKSVKSWDLRGFKLVALDIYKQTNAALATGDVSVLRSRTTPPIFSDMKKQIKQREKAGWWRVEWDLVEEPELRDVELVQARVIAADQKDDETAFVQLTVKIPSKQKFTAYDKHGTVVAGGGDPVRVLDHWVLELPLSKKSQQRYRVAARLQIE